MNGLLWLHLRVRLGRPGGLELIGDVADGLLELHEVFFELFDFSLCRIQLYLKPFDLGLRVVGLFRPALGLPDELLVVTARFFKVGEQGPALLLQRVGVEPDDTVKLLLQGVVLLQKLLVVFVHGLTSACFLAEPLLQLRRVTALDLGY